MDGEAAQPWQPLRHHVASELPVVGLGRFAELGLGFYLTYPDSVHVAFAHISVKGD